MNRLKGKLKYIVHRIKKYNCRDLRLIGLRLSFNKDKTTLQKTSIPKEKSQILNQNFLPPTRK